MLTLLLLLIIVYTALVCDTVSSNYCKLPSNSFQAYNIGPNIFIGSGQSRLWNYNLDNHYVINQKLNIADIFGQNKFEWVDTAVSFNFEKCDDISVFCDISNRATNIVLAIGQKKNESDSRKYGYIAFRMGSSGELGPITQSEMVWGLNTRGTVSGNFWVSLPGYLVYESAVFVPSRNELYASVYDTSSGSDSKYHLMRRKLKTSGEWEDKWTKVANNGFAGMFYANGRAFAMDRNHMIHEFDWTDGEKVEFAKSWSAKEFFNCYRNSTLFMSEENTITTVTVTKDYKNQGNEKVISTTLKTTTTTDNEILTEYTEPIIPNESVTEDEYIYETEQTVVTDEALDKDVMRTESPLNTEPSAAEHTKQVSNGFLWSTAVFIALIFIALFIVILVFIIFRKRRTKTLYISASTNDTKPSSPDKTQSEASIKTIRSQLVP